MSKRSIGFRPVDQDEDEKGDPTYRDGKARGSGGKPAASKRAKGASATPSDAFDLGEEFVCPLTLEFPIDPVMLADGRCYERSAIEEHIRRNGHDGVIKSPVTRLDISAQLIPALLVRNTLARLVDQGVLKGERADAWKAATQKLEDERKQFARIKALAEKGNVRAIEDMGTAYELGLYGLAKDDAKAYCYFLRSGRSGSAGSLTRAAICHLNGTGVERDPFAGMCIAHEAAAMGSEHACSLIAMGHASGKWGKKKDEGEAVYWYRRAMSARVKDTPDECRERGKAYLAAHGSETRVVDAMLAAFNDSDDEDD